jgi:protein-S-isoprenylcysteine O-methyltransferase Ste14
MSWLILTLALIVIVAIGAWTLTRGRNEQQHDGHRSLLTACGVWAVYLLHTAATIAAAVWVDDGSWPTPPVAAWIVGGVLIAFGVGLCAWGMASFRSFSRISGTETDQLVTGGAYRFSRNPQNTGWGIMLVGIAIAGHSTAALLLAAGFWLVFIYYLRHEERFLRRAFADSYIQYCQRAPRFFGRPREQGSES